MSEAGDGTFAKLMEIAETAPESSEPAKELPIERLPEPADLRSEVSEKTVEDVSTIPYISQNYRFTEDELRWLRAKSFDLSETHGAKVPQNTILRIALRELRTACERNPSNNPLTRAVSRLKK